MARATTRWQVECACPEIFSFFAPYPLRPTEQIVLSFLRSRSAKLVPPLALSPSPSPSPFPPPPPSPAPSSSSSSSSSCPLSLFTILLRSNRRDATSVSRPCHFLSLSLFSISFWLPTFSRSALQTRVHLYSIISSSFTAFSRFSGHGRCHAVFLAVSVDVPRLIYPPYRSSPRFVLCRTQSRAKRIILVFRFVSFRFVSFRVTFVCLFVARSEESTAVKKNSGKNSKNFTRPSRHFHSSDPRGWQRFANDWQAS